MCYMSANEERVGVRELRQNLSKYLRRVARGETLEVTEWGRPVAILGPLTKPVSPLDRLVSMGRVTRPERALSELLPPRGRVSTRLSEALLDERAERL